jgi:hypothetical protein
MASTRPPYRHLEALSLGPLVGGLIVVSILALSSLGIGGSSPTHFPSPGASSASTTAIVPEFEAALGSIAHAAGPAVARGIVCQPTGGPSAVCASGKSAADPSTTPQLGFQNSTASALSPASGDLASVVWDLADKEAVFFGGLSGSEPTNQTWLFAHGNWTNDTNPARAPPARWGASMAYDNLTGVQSVLLFGGYGGTHPLNDTWRFSGGLWSPVSAGGATPPPLFDSAMTSWGLNGTLLFGGCSTANCSTQSNATWAFQQNTTCVGGYNGSCWVDLAENGHIRGTSPPGLAASAIGVDPDIGPAGGTVVLYGGFNNSSAGFTRDSNSTWLFDGLHWTNATSGYAPDAYPGSGRSFAAFFWDPSTEWLYLYGGYSHAAQTEYREIWATNVNSWVNDSSVLSMPTSRYGLSVASGEISGTVGLFPALAVGGIGPSGSPENGTWVFERSVVNYVNVVPTTVETNASVGFFSNTTGGTSPVAYWLFGDGAASAASNMTHASHAYTEPRTFLASLHATDYWGVQNITRVPILVRLFSVGLSGPSTLDVGSLKQFSSNPVNGTEPFNYTWTFSDGTVRYGATVSHSFSSVGAASVTLTVRDGTGTVVSQSALIQVNPPLSGTAKAIPQTVDVGSSTVLSASGVGGAPPYSFEWMLPNGRTVNGTNVSYTPTAVGVVTLQLELGDNASGRWNTSVPLAVNPALSFTVNTSSVTPFSGRSVSFRTTISGGTGPYSYSWLFGDGRSSTDAAPTHLYGAYGTYGVNVWVNDSGGGSYHLRVEVKLPRTSGGLLWEFLSLSTWFQAAIITVIVAVVGLLVAVVVRRSRRKPEVRKPPVASGGS